MAPADWVGERSTSAHYEPQLYVDAVGGLSGKERHHQPVVGVWRHGHVTHRVDAVYVADWRRVTRLSPLWHKVTYRQPRTALAGLATRVGLIIRGAQTNIRRGPFSHMRTQDFLSRCALFFSPKVDDLFSRQRTSTQRGKKLAVDLGPLAAPIIRPCWQRVIYDHPWPPVNNWPMAHMTHDPIQLNCERILLVT